MPTVPLNTSDQAVVNAAGTATVVMGPNVGQRWDLNVAAVSVSGAHVLSPLCKVYMGGGVLPVDANLVDGTFTGELDSTSRVDGIPLSNGQKIIAVWTGADVGATATLSILGTVTT